ncbi:MAG: ankyrin repeat domain-containing protein [Paralcaligenes sp.]
MLVKRVKDLGLLVCLVSLLLCTAARAANPADWWIDITNDRAADIKTMLAEGADPNAISPKGQPSIMQAVRDGAWKVYDVLAADHKTAVNALNISHETPLMYLAVVGQTQRAEALIRRGAQVNRLGWTPLHYAASKGHLDTVRMLIAHKAIIDAPSPDGTTALMMAAYAGSDQVVQALLAAGAVVIVQNLGHHNAADWARQGNHNALADRLDALIKKTLAAQASQHDKNMAEQAATPGTAARTVDITGSSEAGARAKPGPGATTGGEPAVGSNAQPAAKKDDSNSTSRYFNSEDNAKSAPSQ